MELYAYVVSGLVSVATAIIILHLESRSERKRALKALYGEIESNMGISQKDIAVAKQLGQKAREYRGITYFDLNPLCTNAYENLKRLGHLLSLSQEDREQLQHVYALISSHDKQTETLRYLQVDYTNPLTTMASLIPRKGGYEKRLETLIGELTLLKERVKTYI